MFPLFRLYEQPAYRKKYLSEFGGNAVMQLKAAGPFYSLDTVIVRKVECDGLASCIAGSRIIDGIIDIQVI